MVVAVDSGLCCMRCSDLERDTAQGAGTGDLRGALAAAALRDDKEDTTHGTSRVDTPGPIAGAARMVVDDWTVVEILFHSNIFQHAPAGAWAVTMLTR